MNSSPVTMNSSPELFSVRGVLRLRSTPIVIAYLLFVCLSHQWINNVPAMSLKKVLVMYNFVCAIVSLYSVFYIIKALSSDWPQSLFSTTESPDVKHAFLVYWMAKILELMDTIFMILRHRQRQISFLHVYHHSTMALLSEFGYIHGSWPTVSFLLGMNCVIHAFLYFYYAQTALSPGLRPAWKKCLTQMQIIQFFIGLTHVTIGYLYYGFCFYCIVYELSMLSLFSNFYFRSYVKHCPTKKME